MHIPLGCALRWPKAISDRINGGGECAFECAADTRETNDLAHLVVVKSLKVACPKSEPVSGTFVNPPSSIGENGQFERLIGVIFSQINDLMNENYV